MNKIFMLILLCLTVSLYGMVGEANAGVGNVLVRSAAKRAVGNGMATQVERKSVGELGALAKRDLVRDRAVKPVTLKKEIQVFRYTSVGKAKSEAIQGVNANSHFTSRATTGRPLTAENAARRYAPTSSNHAPAVRQTWRLDKGTEVKNAKVLGGEQGYGEIVPLTKVPPQNLIQSKRLH